MPVLLGIVGLGGGPPAPRLGTSPAADLLGTPLGRGPRGLTFRGGIDRQPGINWPGTGLLCGGPNRAPGGPK